MQNVWHIKISMFQSTCNTVASNILHKQTRHNSRLNLWVLYNIQQDILGVSNKILILILILLLLLELSNHSIFWSFQL